jgi:hypothetical protein
MIATSLRAPCLQRPTLLRTSPESTLLAVYLFDLSRQSTTATPGALPSPRYKAARTPSAFSRPVD